MGEEKNNEQYFEYKGTKIIITEHFNENGKSFEEVIKDAISREARRISTEEQVALRK